LQGKVASDFSHVNKIVHYHTIQYNKIEEINVDSKAEYTA